MNKIITQDQINIVLNTVYQTNMSARDFDAFKLFFTKLPESDKKPE